MPPWVAVGMPGLRQTLAFILPHVDRVADYARHWERSPQPAKLSDKIVCEIAWLLLARRLSSATDDVAGGLERLSQSLAPEVRTPERLSLALHNPQFASALAIAHKLLSDAGHEDAEWERVIRAALEVPRFDIKERYPHRILERLWVLRLYDISPRVPVEDVLRLSILSGDADPLTMTESDAYAYTHAIMYATDFGTAPLSGCLDLRRVREVVDAAIAWHVGQRNFDLLGEFLLCSAFLGGAASPYAELGMVVFEKTWSRLGFLPGPTFDAAAFDALEGDAARAYAFAELYHVNLVGGLVSFATLRAGDDPAGKESGLGVGGGLRGSGTAQRAVAAMGRTKMTSRTHRWDSDMRSLLGARPELLGPFLDGILVMAIRDGDFELLRTALDLRCEASLPASWIVERAANYLDRFGVVSPATLDSSLGRKRTASLTAARATMDRLRSSF